MHALEILLDPAKIPDRPFVVLFGDELFLRAEARQAVLSRALGDEEDSIAVVRFRGDSASLADVLDEVRTVPFLSRRRVAIVEDADPFVTSHRRELEAYAENPAPSGVLLLEVKNWPGNTKLAKLVDKLGLAIECKNPAERDLHRWLGRWAKACQGVRLTPEAIQLLLELIGPELGVLCSEVEKLATAVASKGEVEAHDVARNVGAGRVETIWKVLDAATTGRGVEALDLLDRLLASGENPVRLLAAMVASLRKVHHAGQLRKARLAPDEACRQAGIPAYRDAIERTLKQHGHLGPSRVGRLPGLTLQADLDLKGFSSLPPRVVLERLLVQLSQPRRD
jgi:DNA polymerase-3 subunit delta